MKHIEGNFTSQVCEDVEEWMALPRSIRERVILEFENNQQDIIDEVLREIENEWDNLDLESLEGESRVSAFKKAIKKCTRIIEDKLINL